MKTIDQLLAEGKRTEWGYLFDRALTVEEQELFYLWMREHIMEFQTVKTGWWEEGK